MVLCSAEQDLAHALLALLHHLLDTHDVGDRHHGGVFGRGRRPALLLHQRAALPTLLSREAQVDLSATRGTSRLLVPGRPVRRRRRGRLLVSLVLHLRVLALASHARFGGGVVEQLLTASFRAQLLHALLHRLVAVVRRTAVHRLVQQSASTRITNRNMTSAAVHSRAAVRLARLGHSGLGVGFELGELFLALQQHLLPALTSAIPEKNTNSNTQNAHNNLSAGLTCRSCACSTGCSFRRSRRRRRAGRCRERDVLPSCRSLPPQARSPPPRARPAPLKTQQPIEIPLLHVHINHSFTLLPCLDALRQM